MNLNNLARTITRKEGGKVCLGIGQVKEVMRITLTELAALSDDEALKVVRRYGKGPVEPEYVRERRIVFSDSGPLNVGRAKR
jgi:hypothetical protein